jgi:aminoglycoside phosphotransferase (APT) family kinase protein
MTQGAGTVPGVDLGALVSWLDAEGVGTGPLEEVRPLTGGTQNVLVSFVRAGTRYVLRRPPVQARPRSDDTVRREARVLAALAGSGVPHARLVVACADAGVLGAAFFVTEHVEGVSLWDEVPPACADPAVQARLGLQVAGAFGALARVDPVAAGLADLLPDDGWAARQPDRWRSRLASYADLDGDDGDRLPGAEQLHAWLAAAPPDPAPGGLVHGDAHLGNVLVRRDGSGVAAVVDWELVSGGDPLLDLGQLLATWPVPGAAYASRVSAPGLPAPAELAQAWAAASGRAVSALTWWRVLAGYRLAVLLEGTRARARAGLADEATGDLLHARALALVDEAAAAAGSARRHRVGLRDRA